MTINIGLGFRIEMSSEPLVDTAGEEPEHNACVRCLMAPLSVISIVPAALIIPAMVLSAPLECAVFACCHLACCRYCCPENIHETARNVVFTPCRWGRVACTGTGHITCFKRPIWPFR